jgi:hypothetical protein
MRESSLFLRLWANASSEAYLRTHRHGGSCGSQRIRTHDFFSVGDALALRNVVGTIRRKRSQDIVNKWRQADIWAKAKTKALNFRQGPARATTRTMKRRGVVREGGRRAQRITSVVRRGRVRWKKEEGGRRAQPSKGASAACGGEEGESRRETGMAAAARAARGAIGGHSPALRGRRATGAAHYQRWCSADLRDRPAAALERGVGRVRWRGRRK